jgi:trehalose synthase-fused probable maltokinase
VSHPPPDRTAAARVAELLPAIEAALPGFLPGQRWYGAKERVIERVDIRDWAPIPEHPSTLLAVVDVVQAGAAAPVTYFLPLGLWPAARADAPGAAVVEQRDQAVRDAIADADTCRALLRGMVAGRALPTAAGGQFVFQAGSGAASQFAVGDIGRLPVRHANVEQSNSSVMFGERLILKALRQLVSGVHPEIEMTRFLAERTTFDRTPALLGWAEYRAPDGATAPVAVLQRFVRNQGDGWSYALAQLAAARSKPAAAEALVERIADLGQTLGRLHLALASVSDDPAFAPETITSPDLTAWRERTWASLDDALARIDRALEGAAACSWTDTARQLGRDVLAGAGRLRSAINGIGELADGTVVRTRHHGDFHLGQTLVADDGWYIIDFEGEPARTLVERRAKQTPLRDVAGLLRSLDYARATVDRQGLTAPDPSLFDQLRSRFLAAYLESVRGSEPRVVPADAAALTDALLALETEKAIYELGYELGNRPDWVEIPLSALARLARPA